SGSRQSGLLIREGDMGTRWGLVGLLLLVGACGKVSPAVGARDGGGGGGGSGDASTAPTPCSADSDCGSSGGRDSRAGRCVECLQSATCGAGKTCIEQRCRSGCRSDKDCTPLGMLCDKTLQYCVQCLDDSECPAGQHCRLEVCTTSVCASNTTSCIGN